MTHLSNEKTQAEVEIPGLAEVKILGIPDVAADELSLDNIKEMQVVPAWAHALKAQAARPIIERMFFDSWPSQGSSLDDVRLPFTQHVTVAEPSVADGGDRSVLLESPAYANPSSPPRRMHSRGPQSVDVVGLVHGAPVPTGPVVQRTQKHANGMGPQPLAHQWPIVPATGSQHSESSHSDDSDEIHPMLNVRSLASQARARGENLPSVGTALHAQGACSPCLFWFSRECKKGYACSYCHVVHQGQTVKKIRPSKRTRLARRHLTWASES